MKQNEFNKLAKEQLREINKEGSDCEESWKFGYMYALRQVEMCIETCEDNQDFNEKIDSLVEDIYYLHEY